MNEKDLRKSLENIDSSIYSDYNCYAQDKSIYFELIRGVKLKKDLKLNIEVLLLNKKNMKNHYDVGIREEQSGYFTNVSAKSKSEAEKIIEDLVNEYGIESTAGHYDFNIKHREVSLTK